MKRINASKNKKQLENKIAAVFKAYMKCLSPEYRKIIVDDLACAFENRLSVLSKAQTHLNCVSVLEGEIRVEAQ